MGLMKGKRATIFLFLILVSLVSGAQRKLMSEFVVEGKVVTKDSMEGVLEDDATNEVHPRMLMVKTNDYGSYNPTPSLSKPPFKLIPN